MRSPAKNALDEQRWGHAQLGLIMAEILGRTVTVIVPDRSTGTETAWTYTPGFAATYGYQATIQLEGVIFLFTRFYSTCIYQGCSFNGFGTVGSNATKWTHKLPVFV